MSQSELPYFDVYRDAKGGWRWRLNSPDHRVVAEAAEPHISRENAEGSRDWVMYWARHASMGLSTDRDTARNEWIAHVVNVAPDGTQTVLESDVRPGPWFLPGDSPGLFPSEHDQEPG